jgi:hypothetical protein
MPFDNLGPGCCNVLRPVPIADVGAQGCHDRGIDRSMVSAASALIAS